jgi:hypothetical protein
MPTTSGNFNLTTNRDAIIARALRIVGAIGQGETPSTTAITEGAKLLMIWYKNGKRMVCLYGV